MRSRSSPDASRSQRARFAALLACALALWVSQALALVHQAGHGDGRTPHNALFAHHDDDPAQCRLVDQLAHLAPVVSTPAMVSLDIEAVPAVAWPASRPAGQAAEGYLARAPPARR